MACFYATAIMYCNLCCVLYYVHSFYVYKLYDELCCLLQKTHEKLQSDLQTKGGNLRTVAKGRDQFRDTAASRFKAIKIHAVRTKCIYVHTVQVAIIYYNMPLYVCIDRRDYQDLIYY